MIRHRLIFSDGSIEEQERENPLPNHVEYRPVAGRTRMMQYAGTEDGVRIYAEIS